MQNDCIVSNIRAIAILSSIVTGPFWRLINDYSTNHFDLHQYVVPLQQALYRWSKDSTVLLNKICSTIVFRVSTQNILLFVRGKRILQSTLENLSDILRSVVNRQLVYHLDSGSALVLLRKTAYGQLKVRLRTFLQNIFLVILIMP